MPNRSTGERAADARVRESEQRLRLALAASGAYAWTWDLVSGAMTRSDSARDLVGLPAESAAWRMWEVIHRDDLARVRGDLERAILDHEDLATDARIVDPRSGRIVWMNLRAKAEYDASGRPLRVVGVNLDVTARKAAEAALEDRARELANAIAKLRRRDEQLRLALCAGRMGAWTWDAATGAQTCDATHLALWDVADVAVVRLETLQARIHPDDRERVRAAAAVLLERGGPGEVEFRIVHRDGDVRWIRSCAVPVRNADGALREVVGVDLDVTAQKRTEQALRDADRRKDEFLATLAHELRNPMAPIRTALEILRLAGHDAEQRGEAQRMMDRQVAHLVRLIDDLLDVSRVTTGKLQLRTAPADLAAIVRAAVDGCRAQTETRGQALEVAVADVPLVVDGDAVRLTQLVTNLVANATKFTDAGGRVRVSLVPEAGEAVLRVADNGIGLPADKLDAIFEMFAQAHPDRTARDGGLGIGLHLVRRIVELHGGTVKARSDGPGRGSEFEVRLPLTRAVAIDNGGSQRGPRKEPNMRVLVVDDNVDATKSLAMLLQILGHEVFAAHDGTNGLRAAEAHRPDVVLLDIGLPDVTGYEVARRIREQPWGHAIRLVALSGWGQEEDKQRSADVGFDVHLTKPADPSDIERVLGEARG